MKQETEQSPSPINSDGDRYTSENTSDLLVLPFFLFVYLSFFNNFD